MHAGIIAHRRSRRVSKGFSLIEMIVVMGIIAVLIALILPAVNGARQSAYRTQCAGNLRQIGQAYTTFVDKHNMNAGSFRGHLMWPTQLLKYMDNREDIFICISDNERTPGALPVDQTLPRASIGIRSRRTLSAQELTRGEVPGFGIGQDFPLAVNSANDKQGVKQIPAPAGQSETPGLIYLAVETGFRVTWNDFIMTVEQVPIQHGGGFKVSVYSDRREQFYAFDLKGANGEILSADFKPGSPSVIIGANGGGFNTSYGVNSQAQNFLANTDTNKVLFVEYNKVVVNVPKTGFTGAWESEIAPRHNGVFNVVFRDGSIQSMVPDEIDPRIPDNYSKTWLPNNPG